MNLIFGFEEDESRFASVTVIPAQAGIHFHDHLDARLRGHDKLLIVIREISVQFK